MTRLCAICCCVLIAVARLSGSAATAPLANVHAHNDYQHARPLFDALDHGFCSVEADIYLIKGQLLVAHDAGKVRAERTLKALYLEPLLQQVRKNGGRVYPNGPEFTLLIDLKGDWQTLYPVLREQLSQYAEMLSTFRGDVKTPGAVMVIITGNRSHEMFKGEAVRYASLDGDLPDLERNDPATLVPWISANWQKTFQWRGRGPVPESDLQKLKRISAKAHEQGRKVRFWGAPDNAAFWKFLRENGVDLINTDDLAGAEKFALGK